MVVSRAVDGFKALTAVMQRSTVSLGVLPPLLLLIPSPEANARYTRNFPPFFYRCDNGQTLVSQVEYGDQMGTGRLLAIYPYSINERQEVLWITKGRQYIAVGGQQYDCKLWNSWDQKNFEKTRGIPDSAALRTYVQRNKPRRLICTGGTAGKYIEFWVSDFVDAGYRHGLMIVDGNEQFGLWYFRGQSGNFNHRGKYYLIQETYRPRRLANGQYEDRLKVSHYLIKDNEYHNMSVCEIESDL